MKSSLRRTYKEKRKHLSIDGLAKISQAVFKRLTTDLAAQLEGKVHTFLPIEKQKEIDTWPIIHWLWNRNVEVIVSKSDLHKPILQHFPLSEDSVLTVNEWGIPEPISIKEAEIVNLKAILIPLLCFDKQGHRVGYGKGYYDRFLADCPNNVCKIGLCHFEPVTGKIEAEASDIPMDYCVTPIRTYKFDA